MIYTFWYLWPFQPAKKISRRSESSSIAIHLGCIAALSDQLVATLSKTSLHHLHHLLHLNIMLLLDLSREDYYLKLCQTVYQGQLDRVPVSVSEWLFGSFVLILFGVDEFFSGVNYHISKDMYWTGHFQWIILAILYYLILLRYIENHSSGLKANLGGKLPTIVVAMLQRLFSCYNNIRNKPNKVALTYCCYVQWFGKQKSLLNDWLKKDWNPDINIVESRAITLNGVMFVSKLEYWWKICIICARTTMTFS